MWFKDVLRVLFRPKKIAIEIAEKEINNDKIDSYEAKEMIRDNNIQDAIEFRKVTINALVIYLGMMCITVIVASLFWIKGIILNQGILTGLRMISGFFLFFSVFNRLSDRGYMYGPGFFEQLNSKFWKMLYLIGMSIMFFTYIVNFEP